MSVRTTITLEDDVFQRIKETSREKKLSFKETVNTLLRKGLIEEQSPVPPRTFPTPPRNLGFKAGVNYDKMEDLLELAEGPLHR